MNNTLQVCLYNLDPEASEELASHIKSLHFVQMLGEVSTPEELANAVQESEINIVFFHLDPDAESVVEVIEQFSTRYPDVALLAMSHETGPGAILAPIRAGCDQFVCEPIDQADLAAAVSRVASKRLLSRSTSRCICVASGSGGAGATSIACNLALEIGQLTEKPCGLVDLDLQFGGIAGNFDCEPKYTLFDLANTGGHFDETVLTGVVTSLDCNVTILPRPDRVDQCDSITPEIVHHAIDLMNASFETVVVDMPRQINELTLAALGQADLIFVVCQMQVPSIRNATRYMDALLQAGIPDDRLQVVVNRGDSTGGRISEKDIEESINKPVFASIPNDYHVMARSIDLGTPISSLARNNTVRAAIGKMASGIIGGGNTKKTARKGLLGRLLSK